MMNEPTITYSKKINTDKRTAQYSYQTRQKKCIMLVIKMSLMEMKLFLGCK